MKNAKNILDTFQKVDIFVENPGNPGTVSVIPNAEIIQFDIIGFLTEIPTANAPELSDETEVVFFPWGAVKMLRPIITEETEGGAN